MSKKHYTFRLSEEIATVLVAVAAECDLTQGQVVEYCLRSQIKSAADEWRKERGVLAAMVAEIKSSRGANLDQLEAEIVDNERKAVVRRTWRKPKVP